VTTNGSCAAAHGHVSEIQRARILAAMIEVSAERGAASVSVAHVVECAGVSRRTFYELYGDREECFLAAFDNGVARALDGVLAVHDPRAKWLDRTRAALVALLSFFDAERGTAQLLIVGSLGAGPRAFERRASVFAQLVAAVDEGRGGSSAATELPPLTAEGVVGGALSVIHARLLSTEPVDLLELASPLMGMIVLPYLGAAAARRELTRPLPERSVVSKHMPADPLRDIGMRLTYRTMRVLMAVASNPACSNRGLALAADVHDQGQISKLLTRLRKLGLIENGPGGLGRGAPNAWVLTDRGRAVERALAAGSA